MAAWNDALRTIREQLDLTQLELSVQTAVSLRSISSYERGTAQPSRDTVLKLAAALRMDRSTVNEMLAALGYDALPTGSLERMERQRVPITLMLEEIDR